MNDVNLPPLPPIGTMGSDVCATVQLYIAVLQDLTPEHVRLVSTHIQTCRACALEYEIAVRSSKMVASLKASAPSAQVDKAVLAAIAARKHLAARPSEPARPLVLTRARKRRPLRLGGGLVAAAAVLLMTVFFFSHLLFPDQTAFALPTNLTWNNYVLHYKQTQTSANGEPYQIEAYHDMATDQMNVTTTMSGKDGKMEMEVVAVQDGKGNTLGMDKMNMVAQKQANNWIVDDSIFDLDALRNGLQNKRVTFLDKETFQGQEVYRIRSGDLVLLLNMKYQPVNVLKGVTGPGTGTPVYSKFEVLNHSQVNTAIWSMSIPPGYTLNQLPAKP